MSNKIIIPLDNILIKLRRKSRNKNIKAILLVGLICGFFALLTLKSKESPWETFQIFFGMFYFILVLREVYDHDSKLIDFYNYRNSPVLTIDPTGIYLPIILLISFEPLCKKLRAEEKEYLKIEWKNIENWSVNENYKSSDWACWRLSLSESFLPSEYSTVWIKRNYIENHEQQIIDFAKGFINPERIKILS
jgi:hypothetical protein